MNNKELEQEAQEYAKDDCSDVISNLQYTKSELLHLDKQAFIAGATSKYVTKQIKQLQKERSVYKKAYEELSCYFDSISDEEQPKVGKRLEKLFKKLQNN